MYRISHYGQKYWAIILRPYGTSLFGTHWLLEVVFSLLPQLCVHHTFLNCFFQLEEKIND